jgi:D-xylose transport system substrate-binding protein
MHLETARRTLLLIAAFSALAAAGCAPARHKADPGKTIRIGFSLDSLVVERWTRDIEVFSRAARDLGAELVLELADQDPGVQEVQIRELANKDIDVLVVVPNDADRLSAVVGEVRAKGIPVLSYDRLVRRAGVDLYVSFDNEKVGNLMADALCKAVPDGKFIVVNGPRNDNNARMLNVGFHRVLDPRVSNRQIRIIGEIWPDTWDSDSVRRSLEELIPRNPDVTAVIAGNDMLAEAAIGVLAENRLASQARVAGQDADLAACQRIAEGTQYATVYKPIDRLALTAAGFAVMLAKGERVPTDSTIDDGAGRVPYVRLEPILVTRETMEDTVIKDGFHPMSDVYRNVNVRP